MRDTQREAGSMQGARCRAWSWDSRVMPWAWRQAFNIWATQVSHLCRISEWDLSWCFSHNLGAVVLVLEMLPKCLQIGEREQWMWYGFPSLHIVVWGFFVFFSLYILTNLPFHGSGDKTVFQLFTLHKAAFLAATFTLEKSPKFISITHL